MQTDWQSWSTHPHCTSILRTIRPKNAQLKIRKRPPCLQISRNLAKRSVPYSSIHRTLLPVILKISKGQIKEGTGIWSTTLGVLDEADEVFLLWETNPDEFGARVRSMLQRAQLRVCLCGAPTRQFSKNFVFRITSPLPASQETNSICIYLQNKFAFYKLEYRELNPRLATYSTSCVNMTVALVTYGSLGGYDLTYWHSSKHFAS
jgi:hypothetical protein